MKEKNFFSLTLNDVACGSYFGSCCCPVKWTVEKGVSLPGITFSQRHITFFQRKCKGQGENERNWAGIRFRGGIQGITSLLIIVLVAFTEEAQNNRREKREKRKQCSYVIIIEWRLKCVVLLRRCLSWESFSLLLYHYTDCFMPTMKVDCNTRFSRMKTT